jgi:hypothetical protein
MTSSETDKESKNSAEPTKISIGELLKRIGGLAVIAGIILAVLQMFISLPFEGIKLGFLLMGGVIVYGLGAALKKFTK